MDSVIVPTAPFHTSALSSYNVKSKASERESEKLPMDVFQLLLDNKLLRNHAYFGLARAISGTGPPPLQLSSGHSNNPSTGFGAFSHSTPGATGDSHSGGSHPNSHTPRGDRGARTELSTRFHGYDQSGVLKKWAARIRCNQNELRDNFSVLIFLVDVPRNPREWSNSRNFVGSFDTYIDLFAEGPTERFYNVQGFVQMSNAILEFSGRNSLEPDVVVPFLRENLHWRVLKVDGTPAELSSLEVTVIMTPFTMPPGSSLPIAGHTQVYPGITRGRPGGSRDP